jgi:AraC family transcriptional regulator
MVPRNEAAGFPEAGVSRGCSTRRARAASKTGREPTGGLPKGTLRRVTDYVGDNLSTNLTLSEIAGVAHMNPFHFSRMFKLSTGLGPYQYVIQHRVERA